MVVGFSGLPRTLGSRGDSSFSPSSRKVLSVDLAVIYLKTCAGRKGKCGSKMKKTEKK